MNQPFRNTLKSGKTLISTIITLSSPQVGEILADAGFDWLFIDGEHAPYEIGKIQSILQAIGNKCPCVVRIPGHEDHFIKQVLDTGVDGIIAPMVNTPRIAEQIVESAKYPPSGNRGLGFGRAQGYGLGASDYINRANEDIAVIVQIEHVAAVQNLESILTVEGIDAVFIGPYDLSSSLGKPGQLDDPEVQDAIHRVRDICILRQKPVGIFAINVETAKPFMEQGYSLIVVGMDALMIGNSANDILTALKP
jgi:2-dehydro-3-deoxyglucarate aldolase/4-hydroxy-2-oxoheptanedioate aldolase